MANRKSGIELSILVTVIGMDVIVTAGQSFCGISIATRVAFNLGVGIGAVIVYYIIRINAVKELKKPWSNKSLKEIMCKKQALLFV